MLKRYLSLKKDDRDVVMSGAIKAASERRQMYTVVPGDTLSSISRRLTGSADNYRSIAEANGISNPDQISAGQSLIIPQKIDKPLKRSEIPTSNTVRVIDNYSPNYDYIVEGDKVYYAKKGNDYWVDISDNETARKNLLNFLGDKYDFRGYEDNEKSLRDRVNSGTFDYAAYRDSLNRAALLPGISTEPDSVSTVPEAPRVQEAPAPAQEARFVQEMTAPSVPSFDYFGSDRPWESFSAPFVPGSGILLPGKTAEVAQPVPAAVDDTVDNDLEGLKRIWRDDGLSGVVGVVRNGVRRRLDKLFMNNEETPVMDPPDFSMGDSEYGLLPQSFTGDTLRYNRGVLPREYFIPESIDMTQHLFGTRNRGDLTELDTEGAVVTAFNPFQEYDKDKVKENFTYLGVDENGRFKVGSGSEFGPGDRLTRTYSNKVYGFAKDGSGNYKFQSDAKHGNSNHNVALVNVEDEKTGKMKESGAFNVLVGKGDKGGTTYGSVTGGRVLVRVGDELRLLSGSVSQIESEFEAMKQRQHTDHGYFYTLDNGSFNKALRTYDQKLTKGDLANYDKKNVSGGNFLYLRPEEVPYMFPQDTVLTPNVRTENDESYKNGHPLENANKGVVLHYTAFSDGDDMTGVTHHFMDPASGASAHLLITPNGSRRVFADPSKVTFHAGYSTFNGVDNVNDFMHGIEFQAPGPNTPLTQEQVDSAVEYLRDYIRTYNIPLESITTHEAVRQAWLDSHTPQEIRRNKVLPKSDLSPMQFQQIVDALKRRVYYKKGFGGTLLRPYNKFDEGGAKNQLPGFIRRDDATGNYITAIQRNDKSGRKMLRQWERSDGRQLVRDSSLVRTVNPKDNRFMYVKRDEQLSPGGIVDKNSEDFTSGLKFVGFDGEFYNYYDPRTGNIELYDNRFSSGGTLLKPYNQFAAGGPEGDIRSWSYELDPNFNGPPTPEFIKEAVRQQQNPVKSSAARPLVFSASMSDMEADSDEIRRMNEAANPGFVRAYNDGEALMKAYKDNYRTREWSSGNIGFGGDTVRFSYGHGTGHFGGAEIPVEILDYLYGQSAVNGIPFKTLLGLSGAETTLGYNSINSTERPDLSGSISLLRLINYDHGIGQSDYVLQSDMKEYNRIRDKYLAGKPVTEADKASFNKILEKVRTENENMHDYTGGNFMKDAWNYFKSGKWNSSEGFYDKVDRLGEEAFGNPGFQKWFKDRGYSLDNNDVAVNVHHTGGALDSKIASLVQRIRATSNEDYVRALLAKSSS